jgi:LCP family protein required for cell wall assembly
MYRSSSTPDRRTIHRQTTTGARHRRIGISRAEPSGGVRWRRLLAAGLSILVASGTGATWWVTRAAFAQFTVSQALPSNAPRSADGAMNILLMGLDSRKDQQGNDLPQAVLDKLHAGDSSVGGYNTNTLILIHVAPDNRAVALSIPRDDYVPFDGVPGYRHIKIKEAYGLTKAHAEQTLVEQGVTDQSTLEADGREAGRAATLSVVRSLVGVPIDYFAEVSLSGFYDLASTLGGVDVCLNHPVQDDFSGIDLPAGPQRLDAAQSLAFVRQRHGLDNGDLDRTHRQQAFLISVMHQLQQTGTFADLGTMNKMIAIARNDIVFSSGWTTEMFRRIGGLVGGNVALQTLPVARYDTIAGQDVNIVEPTRIRAEVRAAFAGSASAAVAAAGGAPSTVDVVDAGHAPEMAAAVSRQLAGNGYHVNLSTQVTTGDDSTVVAYGPDAEADASDIAVLLGTIPTRADPSLEPAAVRVILGHGYHPTSQADRMGAIPTQDGSAAATGSAEPPPDSGAALDGSQVPCVN